MRMPQPLSTTSLGIATTQADVLTELQARNVHVVWSVEDGGYNYELARTMAECTSFDALLDGLREEAECIPSANASLNATAVWRLEYTLPDGKRAAVLARRGSEVAFSRLRAALAQPSLWTSRVTLEVELTPVR
jgi:hypothetical protein